MWTFENVSQVKLETNPISIYHINRETLSYRTWYDTCLYTSTHTHNTHTTRTTETLTKFDSRLPNFPKESSHSETREVVTSRRRANTQALIMMRV